MVRKIVCFDFDGTLISSPLPEEGKKIWKEKTGKDWPHNGWWSKSDSLDFDVFQPKVIEWTYNKFLEETKSPSTFVFLATGRIQKLFGKVLDTLQKNNISIRNKPGQPGLDAVYCNNSGETFTFKRNLFEKILEQNPSCSEFTMYDDREEHIEKFRDWARSKNITINIVDVVNKVRYIYIAKNSI